MDRYHLGADRSVLWEIFIGIPLRVAAILEQVFEGAIYTVARLAGSSLLISTEI